MIVAFTGHRPTKLGGYGPSRKQDLIRAGLRGLLEELKPTEAISGMALGFDQWAAEECLALGIPFLAAIPFAGQELAWPQESQDKYRELLSKAGFVHVVCAGSFTPAKMQIRNQWMVDNSDTLIACFDGSRGGTANCLNYAKLQRKNVRYVRP